jgi:hypothetical protein
LNLQDTENGIGTRIRALKMVSMVWMLSKCSGPTLLANYFNLNFVIDRAPEIAYDLHAPCRNIQHLENSGGNSSR